MPFSLPVADNKEMQKILLCDGHNLAFRAFYGIRELSRSDGFPTNMIHGWLRTFWRLEDDYKPDQIWVFFDLGGCPHREQILPEYKANRGSPPDGFSEQLEWVKKLTIALGYGLAELEGIEADDLIATQLKKMTGEEAEFLIVSSDKDLGQLVTGTVKQLLPPPTANPRIGWRILDESNISEKFGVPADRILDYLSIIGDQSDNIPGLRGVGPKTAVKWLAEYKSLEGIIENAGRLKPKRFCSLVYEQRELLRRNVELVKLLCDVDFEPTSPKSPNLSEIEQILTEMEMHKSLEEAQLRYPN